MFTQKTIQKTTQKTKQKTTHNSIGVDKITLLSAALFAGAACSSVAAHAGNRPGNPSQALSRGLSNSAQLSLAGAAFVVAGTVATLSVAGRFVVTAVKSTGEASVLVLKSVREGASQVIEVSVRVTASALTAAGLAIGSAVTFVAGATGWAIRAQGETIGYIVNETGRELLRQEKLAVCP